MTQDEIIEMERQVARQPERIYAPDEKEFLYYFANLVAAKEREACAKVCEQSDDEGEGPDCWGWHSKDYAKAIRARGEQALAQPKQDGECKYCTHGCAACDARRQSNVLP